MKRMILLAALGAGLLLATLAPAAQAADTVPVEVGAIGLHTFSGKTLAGVALGLHVIPESATRPTQDWCAKHLTLDILQAGSQIDATSATLGASLNLLAPEGGLKLGLTYLWSEKEPAAYLGFSIGL
jgi:hypothetical protein